MELLQQMMIMCQFLQFVTINFALLTEITTKPTPTPNTCEPIFLTVKPESLTLMIDKVDYVTVTVQGNNCLVEGELVKPEINDFEKDYVSVGPLNGAYTDPNGEATFTIHAYKPGNANIIFKTDRLNTTASLLVSVIPNPESTPSATPTPEPDEQSSISGNVINMRGYPIESAKIRLKGIKTKIFRKTTSDEDGLFEFTDLEEDIYILRVLKKRYKSFRQAIELHKGENLDIEIEMIRGRL